jgi:hypothetical protein
VLKKGDFVTYSPQWSMPLPKARRPVIEAIVRTAHKDGTVTIEARFILPPTGERHVGGYLGVVSRRIDPATLRRKK